jgi:hypothetical protein
MLYYWLALLFVLFYFLGGRKKKMKKCCEILEKHPRFKKCEKIKCPYRYDCQEKLEVRAARDIGASGTKF